MGDLGGVINKIRDIPFHISTDGEKETSCLYKHSLLKQALEKIKQPVRWGHCAFRWSDVNFPAPVKNDIIVNYCTHVYLEVLLKENWEILDITWDYPLHEKLPVAIWDGKHGTQLAVPAYRIDSPQSSEEIMTKVLARPTQPNQDPDDVKNLIFYRALNKWLEEIRSRN